MTENSSPSDSKSVASACSTLRHFTEVEMTCRGFQIINFSDGNGAGCSIQQSSAIDDTDRGLENAGSSYLWLGPDDAEPKIMASKAAAHGVTTDETTGWVPYPIPEEVLMTTRMHLHREQVEELIVVLKRWLASGNLDA